MLTNLVKLTKFQFGKVLIVLVVFTGFCTVLNCAKSTCDSTPMAHTAATHVRVIILVRVFGERLALTVISICSMVGSEVDIGASIASAAHPCKPRITWPA